MSVCTMTERTTFSLYDRFSKMQDYNFLMIIDIPIIIFAFLFVAFYRCEDNQQAMKCAHRSVRGAKEAPCIVCRTYLSSVEEISLQV